jgi:hypothetical protein
MRHRLIPFALLLAVAPLAAAQQPPHATPISAADRHAVIEKLDAQLQSHYVFPDVAKSVAAAIRAREAAGAYGAAGDTEAFATALSSDLRTLGKDAHFNVAFDPAFRERPAGPRPTPTQEDIEQGQREVASYGYGLDSVSRLPGNVGYMEVRGFGPTELVGDALTAAMTVLGGTDALIVDLRRNGGGEPSSVAHLMSHFFAIGDQRHLNDLVMREGNGEVVHQYWTNPAVGVHYTKPVYVLTSARTFSGGEEFAYDMQTQKRATLVGETTGGGANPGDPYSLGHGFAAFIPNGRALNPVTQANWEHVGVKPDVAVPAAKAKDVAHAAALRALIAASKDADEKQDLAKTLANVEAGTLPAPVYTPRR